IKEIKVKAGDKVKVGQAILSVEDGAGAATGADQVAPKPGSAKAGPAKADAAPKQERANAPKQPQAAHGNAEAGDADDDVPDMQPDVEAQNQSRKPDKAGVKDPTVGPQAAADDGDAARPFAAADTPDPSPDMPPAPAAPSVRRMARELGVDVNEVSGSGPGGRISVDDVKAHTKRLVSGGAAGGGGAARVPLP